MSTPDKRQRPLSIEEYLELEVASDVRHEYVAGEIYAMTGATRRHNRIVGNILTRLYAVAGDGPCRVYFEAVKLRAARNIVYYPDVMVACGPEGDDPYVEDAPCLVVEVLSPSTETTDRREKAFVYQQLKGLEAYVIVHQDVRHAEWWWRDERGDWRYTEVAGGGHVPFPCPGNGLEMTLDEIYRGAEPPAPAPEGERPPGRVREASPATPATTT
jgi:Uma2 family endonuclease